MTRPLLDKGIAELEAMADRNRASAAELKLILDELRHRKVPRARAVERRIAKFLHDAAGPPPVRVGGARKQAEDRAEAAASGPPVRTAAASPPKAPPTPKAAPSAPQPSAPQPSPQTVRWTAQAVATLRAKLIDLGKKNPLISFKHGGRGVTHLRIVDERPDLLCEAIGRGAVGFEPLPGEDATPPDETTAEFGIAYARARLTDETFLAATEKLGDEEGDAKAWQTADRALRGEVRRQIGLPALDYGKALDIKALALAHGFDPSYDLKPSDGDDVAAHHEDSRIRVLFTAKELDKRLDSVWERYRSHRRETGLHTLFLVVGFVQWYDEGSDVALHAPLLLLPVELKKQQVRSRHEYQLSSRDEGLQVNVALGEKMRRHFDLELPALREAETPESYFIRIADVLARRPEQRLSLRRFATLAVLPFPRMVLWKDLDPAAWSDGGFARHPLLPGLLGASEMVGDRVEAETIDIDAQPWADTAPVLIRPADASQHSAIIDMAAGHHLAIEGPPGTGKSETITNIVATALAAGKRVLFVAEKEAALRVVAGRLRDSGFGPLLLELHGDNANRAAVYDGLRERLKVKIASNEAALLAERGQLRRQRDLIRRYLSLISETLGATGRSAYWLAWRKIKLRSGFDRADVDAVAKLWRPASPREVDRVMLAGQRSRLDDFGKALAALDAAGAERTLWTRAERLDPFDQRPQRDAAGAAASAADAMARAQATLEALAPLGMPGPGEALPPVAAQLGALEGFGAIDEAVARGALRDPEGARALLRQQTRWRRLCAELDRDVGDAGGVGDAAIASLGVALAGVRPAPATLAATRERLAAIEAMIDAEARSADERRELAHALGLPATASVSALRETLAALAELNAASPTVAALYDAKLLDPLTGVAIDRERAAAGALSEERAAVGGGVTDAAWDADPEDLDRVADVLADSGFLARMAGGDYRAAKSRATRLVRDFADRAAGAEALRRLARHRIKAARFAIESAAAAYFPEILWRGIDADWIALDAATRALTAARDRLSTVRHDDALARWLAMPPHERARASTTAGRALPVLFDAETNGLGACSASRVGDELKARRDALAALVAALEAVGARSDGEIVRDGEALPDRLSASRIAAGAFAESRARDGFSWVGEIAGSLEPLARALDRADAFAAAKGPLAVTSTLRISDTPVALLDAMLAARSPWLAAEIGWRTATGDLARVAGLNVEALRSSANADATDAWSTLATLLGRMAEDEGGARLAADLRKYGDALDEAGLAALGSAALDGVVPADRLADMYELLLVRALMSEYLGGDGAELGRLGSITLDAARKEFVRIDKALHGLEAKAIVASRMADKGPKGIGFGPRGTWTEMSLLEHELELRKPRTPVRDVVYRAGAAMQALKPVWMMSPTSAAQYIRPDSLHFDLLVVDEASQMRPEFAISAIMRGSQFVVVGDVNQLPPTDFFSMASDDDDSDEEDAVAVKDESILQLANDRFRHKRRLIWHYRSQHESLIQFSNREFYENDLVVFPSPTTDDDLLGVKSIYVGGAYEASINQDEAQAVIEEAFRLMRAYPERSIGIATMNAKQTELIRNEFDRLILEAPEVRAYVDEYAGGLDEFFIKNLENVQGDERDIILISTVFGPGKDGVVRQNFGPMNREVGWRRLNVLVTRAKLSTRIFTSLRPNDIKATADSKRGVHALKAYLTYAANGAQYDDGSGGEPDSDFEVFVADALRAAGYDIVHQVGVEGFRIDLGVRHADYPIGFIAGIECDGASFHSGYTVRDRDRIRQTVLEAMGWRIYRIWSTDWFADPELQMRKLLARLDGWRADFAARYAHRPPSAVKTPASSSAADNAPDDDPPPPADPPAPDATRAPATASPVVSNAPRQPSGRAMRPLDDISWYEVSKGLEYEIWLGDRYAGDVEILSRATAAPRVYGGRLSVARSEYEGRVAATSERFKTHDIHAAVREVARMAKLAMDLVPG